MTMTQANSAKASQSKEQHQQPNGASERLFDRELGDLPADLRWREWMMRVEAVIFASAEPVSREVLARVVGKDCSIDLLIDDLREDLRSRPYELVSVAGGWQHRTRSRLRRDNTGLIGSDAISHGSAVGVRSNGADGDCVFPASDEERAVRRSLAKRSVAT
jgi:hypothetical protein